MVYSKLAMDLNALPRMVEAALRGDGDRAARLAAALEAVAQAFGAVTATLHCSDPPGEVLHLVASRGLPEKILPVARAIPFGKGMAGLCAARREPVTVCNLQTDASGVARPAAKETGAGGAIVVPLLGPRGGKVLGTLGVGKPSEHVYSEEELGVLKACAGAFAAWLDLHPGFPGE